ncbi:unnamed protein product [Heterobilharzia americana]|nr:unnamed protein product [Heterobilharzia americana]
MLNIANRHVMEGVLYMGHLFKGKYCNLSMWLLFVFCFSLTLSNYLFLRLLHITFYLFNDG